MTRDEAIASLGLEAAADVDAASIQRAFERLARRYPQPGFPERFRRLLEARDQLLHAGRGWREQLTSRTLDLAWLYPHLACAPRGATPEPRKALQDLLRAGYLAEPLPPNISAGMLAELLGGDDLW